MPGTDIMVWTRDLGRSALKDILSFGARRDTPTSVRQRLTQSNVECVCPVLEHVRLIGDVRND